MKSLLLAAAFMCCFLLSAHASETETFVFDGAENLKELLLKKEVYETRYRTESYDSTCTRQVQDGTRTECRDVTRQNCHTVPRTCHTEYRNVCHNNPDICHTAPPTCRDVCHQTPPACRNVCHSGPNGQICREVCSSGSRQCREVCSGGGRVCRDGGQSCTSQPYQSCSGGNTVCNPYQDTVCSQVPTYHNEDYACVRTREIPYQVLAQILDGKAVINFANVPAGVEADEKFTVAVNDAEGITLNLEASKKLLVFADKVQTIEVQGINKTINATINVNFLSVEEINQAIKNGIADISIQSNVLFFTLGQADSQLVFKHKIKLVQKKLGKDEEILNKEIDSSLFEVSNLNGKKLFALNLAKLNLKLKDKKHEVTINSEVVLDNKKPINTADIPLLKAVKEIVIKL